MKNRRRFKKIGIPLPKFIEDLRVVVVERALGVAVTALFIVVALLATAAFVHGSDYFCLRSVETKGCADPAVSLAVNRDLLVYCKGKNIFDIDLQAFSRRLMARNPDARQVVLKRTFPDRLTVSFDMRRAVAIIIDDRYHPVDDDGILLSAVDPRTASELVIISGVEMGVGRSPGKKIESRQLKRALDLLREVRKTKILKGHRLDRVNVGSPDGLVLIIDGEIEARIGSENFKERLKALAATLRDPRLAKDKVRYIDVRFNDVSIGTK